MRSFGIVEDKVVSEVFSEQRKIINDCCRFTVVLLTLSTETYVV
jgi:hypothetical protein